jgi:NAD+ diphosphatase
MKHCYHCGFKLELKELKNEGLIPYCPSCNEYRFPIFSTAISAVIVNKDITKTLLIRQYNMGLDVLVAGYINKGESAEEALYREIKEEVGLTPIYHQFQKTEYWPRSNTLLINFYCIVDDMNVTITDEVQSYKWFDIDEAYNIVDKTRLVGKFYTYFYENNYKKLIKS